MATLIPVERRSKIYELLHAEGTCEFPSLSEHLSVSEMTIRRDLEQMEEEGLLERTHGGAVLNRHMNLEPLYSEKHRAHQNEKRWIGQAAAGLVEPGDTLLINSGSTTLQIFRYLSGKRRLKVITSNMNAFLERKTQLIWS